MSRIFWPPSPRAPDWKLNFKKFCPDAPISSRACCREKKSSKRSCSRRTSTPLARTGRNSFRSARTAAFTVAARATRKVPSPPCSPRFANWRNPSHARSKPKSFSPDWLTRNMRRPVRGRWRRADSRRIWPSSASRQSCGSSRRTRAVCGWSWKRAAGRRTARRRSSAKMPSTKWRASWMCWKRITPRNCESEDIRCSARRR